MEVICLDYRFDHIKVYPPPLPQVNWTWELLMEIFDSAETPVYRNMRKVTISLAKF